VKRKRNERKESEIYGTFSKRFIDDKIDILENIMY